MVNAASGDPSSITERIKSAREIKQTLTVLTNPNNWTQYRSNLIGYLTAAKLAYILDDTISPAPFPESLQMDTSLVKDIISSTIDAKYLDIIPPTASPKDMMDTFQLKFADPVTLRQKLHKLERAFALPHVTIQAINKMEKTLSTIVGLRTTLGNAPSQTELITSIKESITGSTEQLYLRAYVNKEYNSTVQLFDDMRNAVKVIPKQSKYPANFVKNIRCHICSRLGHKANACWTRHGKPQSASARPGTSNAKANPPSGKQRLRRN